MDFFYWKDQIYQAKDALKKYFNDAEHCEKVYSDESKNYNILFSNISVLDANLRLNNPKPDIQRRFLQRIESNKKKATLYAEVARILEGAVEFVSDISNVDEVINTSVHNANLDGRGVAWIEYQPTIDVDDFGNEYISDRKIKVESIKYDEFLCSTADSPKDIWWVAKRHLLTAKDIKNRFGFEPDLSELSFKTKDETEQKRGEVWEIWDKSTRKRAFLLLTDSRKKFLEVQDDPYLLEGFFPCVYLTWVYKEKSDVPVPEYKLYEKKADLLEINSKKIASISDELKFVQVVGSQDKSIAATLTKADNGDVVSVPTDNVQGAITSMIGTLPVSEAVGLLQYLSVQKEELKQDIYDITGISDIMRGVTDARETASAQYIKGLFGSLRFQDRQKQVQNFRKDVYRIIAEIIAEHYPEDVLAAMTCTYLPTIEEKQMLEMQIRQEGGQVDQSLLDKYNSMVNLPTWEEVMQILHTDHLRDYTVDVETTATAFDNQQQQMQSIQQLTQMYLELTKVIATMNSPALLKGFLPLVKMNLMSIKVSSSIAKELEEAIDGAYSQLESASKQPPAPTPEQMALQAQAQKDQLERQTALDKLKVEMEKVRSEMLTKDKEIALREQEIAIKQQEADRKEAELQMQYDLKMKEIQTGVNINTNISGDVASLE